ncbi:hypothetical protein [uncultured Brachyspira sp.]|nr:hypothetical protein [uncultured Brachyspira sp.]
MFKWLRCKPNKKTVIKRLLLFIFITVITKLLDMVIEYVILYILNTVF